LEYSAIIRTFAVDMKIITNILKPLMPILAAAYGFALIYVTALPLDGDTPTIASDLLSCLITLVCIILTFFLVKRVEPKLFTSVSQFSLKMPKWPIIIGLLMIAPLWLVAEGYLVYGLTSLFHTVQLETLTYTASEVREDLTASIHAVLLAPVLEELCFRQMAISPFRPRSAQVAVCVVMAVLFGMLHVRNCPGAFLAAMVYGLVFIWSRNIWYGVALHAGHNLTATLLAIYCWLGLGDMQMAKIPVIFLTDTLVIIGSIVLAIAGILVVSQRQTNRIKEK
jgi:membrane protease YdiL (CAAX protease family)